MTSAHALEVRTLFRGVVIGTKYVVAPTRHSHARSSTFVIGASTRADAPISPAFLRHLGDDANAAHTLIACDDGAGDDAPYALALAPGMIGLIGEGERAQRLPVTDGSGAPGARVALGRGVRARVDCGAITFLIAATELAPALPPAPFPWRSVEGRYHLASVIGVALVLLLLMSMPGDPRALALDLFAPERGLVKYLIKPPVVAVAPAGKERSADAAGGSRPAASGPAGAPGSEASRDRNHRQAIKGQVAPEARRASAPAPIDPREAGVLGVFRRSAAAQSILESGPALGAESATVLGDLIVGPAGVAYGHGLAAKGTGEGGAGTGDRALGEGRLGTMGIFGGGGDPDPHHGHPPGLLGPHRAHVVPAITLIEGRVTGSLDREIVRRIIRRHINEVKYCYEQELTAHRDLGGRVTVQFTIAATGQVLAAARQLSTLGNPRVEGCIVQAVRRWEFPRPNGGGLVMVSYPFLLTPAGAGD